LDWRQLEGAVHCESGAASASDALLRAGSHLAARLRSELLSEVGLTTSAGIAHNKLLSKLVSGLQTPNQQTSLPSSEAQAFLAPLPVRALRGVGRATERSLAALNIALCCQLASAPRDVLARELLLASSDAPQVSIRLVALLSGNLDVTNLRLVRAALAGGGELARFEAPCSNSVVVRVEDEQFVAV
jgi:hypothetical protein